MKASETIPKNKFNMWYEIMKSYDGRFLSEPIIFKESVMVSYEMKAENYSEMERDFQRFTTPIIEKRKIGLLEKVKNLLNSN